MTDNKQTVQFEIEYFQGVTCIGCAVIEDLDIEVEFTDDEIAQMRQLVSQLDEALYSQGLMPVLKDAAPELHERIDFAARSAIFDFLVEDGIIRVVILPAFIWLYALASMLPIRSLPNSSTFPLPLSSFV